eukprot:1142974-Pyramimonas_sp.AAC.1
MLSPCPIFTDGPRLNVRACRWRYHSHPIVQIRTQYRDASARGLGQDFRNPINQSADSTIIFGPLCFCLHSRWKICANDSKIVEGRGDADRKTAARKGCP